MIWGGFPLFLVQHPYQGLNLGSEQDWLVSIVMRIHEHVSNECENHDDPYEIREKFEDVQPDMAPAEGGIGGEVENFGNLL